MDKKRLEECSRRLKKIVLNKDLKENGVSLSEIIEICKKRYNHYKLKLQNLNLEVRSINKTFKFKAYDYKKGTLTLKKENEIYNIKLINDNLIELDNKKDELTLYEIDSLKYILKSMEKYNNNYEKIDMTNGYYFYPSLDNCYIVTTLDDELLLLKISNIDNEYSILIKDVKSGEVITINKEKIKRNFDLKYLSKNIKIEKEKLPTYIKDKVGDKKSKTRKRKIFRFIR